MSGTANIVVAGNEFFDAGTGGFTAGQGTGFESMVAPWITYEAENITFTRNVIHDTHGAGVGVKRGRNVTITGVRGTNLPGSYTLRLRAAGTGIVDLAGTAFAAPVATTWRMTRWTPARW